jgi:hypothetical protein
MKLISLISKRKRNNYQPVKPKLVASMPVTLFHRNECKVVCNPRSFGNEYSVTYRHITFTTSKKPQLTEAWIMAEVEEYMQEAQQANAYE